ncbi:MAG: hypothetical protein Q9212_002702 [Teloschistes hypoglaucus]
MGGGRNGARGERYLRDPRGAHRLGPRDGRAGSHRDPHGMADHGRREGERRRPRGQARGPDPRDWYEGQRGRRHQNSESEDDSENSADSEEDILDREDRRALEEEMAMYDDDRFVPPRGRAQGRVQGRSRWHNTLW